MEYIIKTFTILAAICTASAGIIRVLSNLIDNIIKIKYRNISYEKSIFKFLFTTISLVLALLYILLIFKSILNINKVAFNENIQASPVVWTICILFFIIMFSSNLLFINSLFIISCRMKESLKSKVGKVIISFNVITGLISIGCIIIFTKTIYEEAFNKINIFIIDGKIEVINKIQQKDLSIIFQILILLILCLFFFMLSYNVFEKRKDLMGKNTYIIITPREIFNCYYFLEYDKYYLIVKGNKEIFIKRDDVVEIIRENIYYRHNKKCYRRYDGIFKRINNIISNNIK